jgi:hypothetical protein
MSQTFRPLLRNQKGKLVVILILVALGGHFAAEQSLVALVMVIFFIGAILFYKPPLLQKELRLDGQGLSIQFEKETSRILWQDVRVARQFEHAGQDYLELFSEQATTIIPLEFFDRHAVWESVRRYVPPEALEDATYKQTPTYQEWWAKTKLLLTDIQEPLCVGYPIWQSFLMATISWIIIGLICRVALMTLGWVGAISCLGLLLLLTGKMVALMVFYRVEMTSEAVTVVDLRKRYVMRWDEVEYIEHSAGWGRFIIIGRDKRLSVIGLRRLAGQDRTKMIEMLNAQIEHRHIELRHEERALYTRSRNVAVGRSA